MLTWVTISAEKLRHNAKVFRKLIGKRTKLAACVKANAYGHGINLCASTLENEIDWFMVNALFEVRALREAGIKKPIYFLGYVPLEDLEEACVLDCRFVVYNRETVQKLGKIAKKLKKKIPLHIKVETGNNRQGVSKDDLPDFARYILSFEYLYVEGISTHFANIEDTTDHSYADFQLKNFKECCTLLEKNGIKIPLKHCANTAATILFPKTHMDMVRVGIGLYGMWPSPETYVSAYKENKKIALQPVMTWKTKIAQIKNILAGSFIGYGCTYKTTHDSLIAILPLGYYDGYDRRLSNTAYVLIHGKRAPVRGRVCMNIIMVDVTNIPDVRLEDEVVLLGLQGDEEITAEQMASWIGTINYEVTTRIHENIPRILV